MTVLYWLLSHEALHVRTLRAIREARTPLTAKAPTPAARTGGLPSSLDYDGAGTATIYVRGVLTPTPDAEAAWFDEPNTTYGDLQESLRIALADPGVTNIVWDIDSPGGAVDGLFALLDDIEDARAAGVKMSVIAENAHSAAYGIAAAVGNITARSRMSSFGSVGVATSGFISGGICGTVVDLTNTDAPEKRPNLATDEGRAVVVRYLDQLAGEFMGAIARGRGVDPSTVAERFGRGSSMLAGPAKTSGLIDDIAGRATYARTLTHARTADRVPSSMSAENETPAPVEPPAPAEAEPEAAPESKPEGEPAKEETPAPVEQAPAAPAPADAEPKPAPAASRAPAAANAPRLISAAEYAEFQALRADRDKRESVELRALCNELVTLGAETPATAFAKGEPVPRLAAEGLPALRARVSALKAARPEATKPLLPPTGPATGEDALTDFERADAAKIKDPDARARFIASRLARKQKNDHG